MNLFKKDNIFKGVFSQPTEQNLLKDNEYNVEFLITDVDSGNNTFNGEMTWTQLNNSKTKVQGKYNKDEDVYLVEYELIEGDNISFPTIYEGKIIKSSISGIAKHANYKGTFFLELVKTEQNQNEPVIQTKRKKSDDNLSVMSE